MAKITLEEYQDYKAKGIKDVHIAERKGISQDYLCNLKKQWKIRPNKSDTEEKKHIESKSIQDEIDAEKAEYESLISKLKNELASNKELVDSLKAKIAEYEEAASDDLESEAELRQENLDLADKVGKYEAIIENQKYQLGQYAKQNMEQQDEIEHLKYFANRYLAV